MGHYLVHWNDAVVASTEQCEIGEAPPNSLANGQWPSAFCARAMAGDALLVIHLSVSAGGLHAVSVAMAMRKPLRSHVAAQGCR